MNEERSRWWNGRGGGKEALKEGRPTTFFSRDRKKKILYKGVLTPGFAVIIILLISQ